MTINPFEPPKAEVFDSPPADYNEDPTPIFFSVSPTKLLILSFCTLGIYEYYWFYKNWQLVRRRTNADISPFWRAFFAVFFCYQLFDLIRNENKKLKISDLPAGLLASAWIIVTILWKLPDPYWLITFLAVLFLLPVQHAINRINKLAVPTHADNSRFTAWNWITVGIGGPFFLLALYRTFFPNQ